MEKKQGKTNTITQKSVSGSDQGDAPEFKGDDEEIKKTSILTMQNSKPTRIYFENGKQVRFEVAK